MTFEVDTGAGRARGAAMPAGVVRVAESGIGGPDDAAVLADAGYHAVLVGEPLVTAGDPARRPRRACAPCTAPSP